MKCKPIKGGYVDPESICEALTMATERGPAGRRKGLFSSSMINLDTRYSLGVAITLKAGEFSKNGIYLNFCPFCGGELRDSSEDGEQ